VLTVVHRVKVSEISPAVLSDLLKGPGIKMTTGPFLFGLQTEIESVIDGIRILYRDFSLTERADFVDFHVALKRRSKLFRYFRPQVAIEVDGDSPAALRYHSNRRSHFSKVPLIGAFTPMRINIFHAAAIERDGCAAILPAPPGSRVKARSARL